VPGTLLQLRQHRLHVHDLHNRQRALQQPLLPLVPFRHLQQLIDPVLVVLLALRDLLRIGYNVHRVQWCNPLPLWFDLCGHVSLHLVPVWIDLPAVRVALQHVLGRYPVHLLHRRPHLQRHFQHVHLQLHRRHFLCPRHDLPRLRLPLCHVLGKQHDLQQLLGGGVL